MIKITPQYKRVSFIARKAHRSIDKAFKMVYLRNGVLFASDGYMLSACKFPSSISGVTQMIEYTNIYEKEEFDEKSWKQCEGIALNIANHLWDNMLKSKEHQKGKAITLHKEYLKESIDWKETKSDTVTMESGGKFDPVVVISNGVKSIIMPMLVSNDEIKEFEIGEYN
jgi:hypothetical protein